MIRLINSYVIQCIFSFYVRSVAQRTMPHYKWRCKTKDLRQYHNYSEVFLKKKNYVTEWRHQYRWYMYNKYVCKTFSSGKHYGAVLRDGIRTAKFCTKVFVMPKHTWIILVHVSTPCNRFISTVLQKYFNFYFRCQFSDKYVVAVSHLFQLYWT